MSFSNEFGVPDLTSLHSSESEQVRYTCVDCGCLSPPAETSYTLISARYGWRLHRFQNDSSKEMETEWRCPECWEAFRGRSVRPPSLGPPEAPFETLRPPSASYEKTFVRRSAPLEEQLPASTRRVRRTR